MSLTHNSSLNHANPLSSGLDALSPVGGLHPLRGLSQNQGSGTSPIKYNFQVANFAGDTFTQLLGINNGGTIAGYHGAGTTPQNPNKGFTLTLPASFISENFPGSVQTQVVGINNQGATGGFFVDGAGSRPLILGQTPQRMQPSDRGKGIKTTRKRIGMIE